MNLKKSLLISLVLLILFSLQAKTQELKWYSIEEAMKLNKIEKRKIMIDVYTDWCGWCKVMDRETFNNLIISKILKEKYYPVKFNAESRDTVLFNGKFYGANIQGQKAIHQLAVYLLQGKLSYPSIVFIDENNQIITAMSGYRKPNEMEPILQYISASLYLQNVDFQEYLKTFKSKLPAEKNN
jgi:thioredoxin-related protein